MICISTLAACATVQLYKQGDNIQPWRTPFPIWNQSVVPCPILTVASWPAYKFLKRQIRWSGTPISSWEIDGETVETVSDFIFWDSKITEDGDCSHEIKRRLILGKKVMTNLDSILKSRDITLPTKVCLVKAMVFPVVMYGCENWTWIKLSTEELMLLNCGVGEDSWESLGLQGDPTSPFWRRSALGFLWKELC